MNKFEKLKAEIIACKLCEHNFGYEPHPIFWGNKNAKIMQISQAPSLSVHNTLKPFKLLAGVEIVIHPASP